MKTNRTVRSIAAIVACLVSFTLFGAVLGAQAGAQDKLPDNVCAEYKKWKDGGSTAETVDIVLLPLESADIPNQYETLVGHLANRTFQGAALDQAIRNLSAFLGNGCSGDTNVANQTGTPAPTAAANATPAATADPNATPSPTAAAGSTTPTPAATTAPGSATPAPTPSTALPNTGVESDQMALIGGFVLFAGLAIAAFTRQRN